jgi:hypothetical protein
MGFHTVFPEGPEPHSQRPDDVLQPEQHRRYQGTLSIAAAIRLGVPHLGNKIVSYSLPTPPQTCALEIYYGKIRLGSVVSFGSDGIIPLEELRS